MSTAKHFKPLPNDGAPYKCGYRGCTAPAVRALAMDTFNSLREVEPKFVMRALCGDHCTEAAIWLDGEED